MATDHPFQQLFETFGKLPEAHAESVNSKARERIRESISVGLEKSGHCVLLKAPRAGHGKTHLLTRLQHELGGTHEFVPIHALGGSRIDASTVMDDIIRRLVRPLPAAGGLTVFDLATRRLFSSSLQPLVRSGEVPCQDREGALNALRTRPIETFDFHHPSAVTAHWARENFELLGPRLSIELSQTTGFSLREISFWVNAMFRFAATPIDNPGRVRALVKTVFEDPTADADAHERLVGLLGLMTSLMRVVLVADELEGFSSDETAALRFASFIGALRQSVDRLDVVISINQDVWDSAFLPRLSGGLADRLSEVVVELKPLGREEKIAILESRAPGMGLNILNSLDADSMPSYARGVIGKAAEKSRDSDSSSQKAAERSAEAADLPEKKDEPAIQSGPSVLEKETVTAEIPESKPKEVSEESPAHPMSSENPIEEKPKPEAAEDFVNTSNAPQTGYEAAVSETPEWPSPEVAPSKVGATPEVKTPSQPAQETPPSDFTGAPDSSFSATAPTEEPSPQPIKPTNPEPPAPSSSENVASHPAAQTTPENAPPAAEELDPKADRVDNLLKQFRERYGKS